MVKAKEAIRAINELAAIQTLEQICVNGTNESARVAAATRLLDYAAKDKSKTEGAKFYEELLSYSDEEEKRIEE